MTMEIDATELDSAFEDLSDEAAEDFAHDWFSQSQEILYSEGDDHEYNVYPIAQSGIPPQWDDERGGYVFGYSHEVANIFEVGARPHEIRAKDAEFLAFPDENGNIIFRKKVHHPGLPALEYVEQGRERAKEGME